MDQKSIAEAVKQICDEKGIPFEAVIETIEAALAAAEQRATERREPRERRAPAMPTETPPAEGEEGEEVKRFNPKTDLQIADAKKMKKGVTVGDVIKTPLSIPGEFGRMAAQTAKQVITQKLREIERESLYG